MKTLLLKLINWIKLSLFGYEDPEMLIIIGEERNYSYHGSKLLSDYFYLPDAPDDWVHTLRVDRLMNKEWYVKFPECFALVEGHRIADQLCLSQYNTFSLVNFELSRKMKDNPSIKLWSISQGDNYHWCECEKCKNRLPTDTLIEFVNKIAAMYPDKQFHTLAYLTTVHTGTIKPLPNVMVMISTIELSKDTPYYLSTRADSITWIRNLKRWLELTPNIGIWDYYGNFKHLMMPNPTINSIGPNMAYFRSLGIKNFIIQTDAAPGHEFSELKSHIIVNKLKNPKLNTEILIENFLFDEYGEDDGNIILEYLETLSFYAEGIAPIGNYKDLELYRDSFLREGALEIYSEILSGLFHYAYIAPEYRMKLNEVLLQIAYVRSYFGDKDAQHEFLELCEEFNNVVTVNEHRQTYIEFLDQLNT